MKNVDPAGVTAAVRSTVHSGVPGSAAVMALKPLLRAKTRVDSVVPELRQQLAWAMALDTLTTVASVVDHVVVVSDQPDLHDTLEAYALHLDVVAEPDGGGMNPALQRGAAILREQGFSRILACVGDLPALRPTSLVRVLEAARPDGRSFVPDASGIGTTMLIADRCDLDPLFQGASSAAHRDSGALPLTDLELGATIDDARRDVDTEADLLEAYDLGLGRHTTALIDPKTRRLGRYATITITSPLDADGPVLVITADGAHLPMPRSILTDLPLIGRSPESLAGQRLHAALAADHVLAVWR